MGTAFCNPGLDPFIFVQVPIAISQAGEVEVQDARVILKPIDPDFALAPGGSWVGSLRLDVLSDNRE